MNLKCQHLNVRKLGFRYSPNNGKSQKFQCKDCGKRWAQFTEKANPFMCSQARRLVKSVETLIKAFALYAIGISLEQIQCLLKIKSETVSKRLLEHFTNGSWDLIVAKLNQRFRFFHQYSRELGIHLHERSLHLLSPPNKKGADLKGNFSILSDKFQQFQIECKDSARRQTFIRHASRILGEKVTISRHGKVILVNTTCEKVTKSAR